MLHMRKLAKEATYLRHGHTDVRDGKQNYEPAPMLPDRMGIHYQQSSACASPKLGEIYIKSEWRTIEMQTWLQENQLPAKSPPLNSSV